MSRCAEATTLCSPQVAFELRAKEFGESRSPGDVPRGSAGPPPGDPRRGRAVLWRPKVGRASATAAFGVNIVLLVVGMVAFNLDASSWCCAGLLVPLSAGALVMQAMLPFPASGERDGCIVDCVFLGAIIVVITIWIVTSATVSLEYTPAGKAMHAMALFFNVCALGLVAGQLARQPANVSQLRPRPLAPWAQRGGCCSSRRDVELCPAPTSLPSWARRERVFVACAAAVFLCFLCEIIIVASAGDSAPTPFYRQCISTYLDESWRTAYALFILTALLVGAALKMRHPFVEAADDGTLAVVWVNVSLFMVGAVACACLVGLTVFSNGAAVVSDAPLRFVGVHMAFTKTCFTGFALYELSHSVFLVIDLARGCFANGAGHGSPSRHAWLLHYSALALGATCNVCGFGAYMSWRASDGRENIWEWISVSFIWGYFVVLGVLCRDQ